MKKTILLIGALAAAASAQTITSITFAVGAGGEAVDAAPTASDLAILTDGIIDNNAGASPAGFSILVSPTSDATTDLVHEYTINFTAASDITSFELFSDFRILDAYVTLADIAFYDGLNATGANVGGATGLVFGAPSTPDPAGTNSNWINPTSSVTQNVSATGALSAVITIQEVNELTTNGEGGYQLRELSFNGALIPEPSSAALLGLGGLALIGRRKRA